MAAQEVRDKIASILNALPEGVDTPLVNKFDLDANPIITISISGRRDMREITEIAKRQIQEPLQTINGVGNVFMTGGRSRAINVRVDIDRLVAYGLSIEDVRRALQTQNLEIPGGIVDQGQREMVLRTLGRVDSAEKFNDVVIANRKDYSIRIRDVGEAVDSIEEPRGLSRLDGHSACLVVRAKTVGHQHHRNLGRSTRTAARHPTCLAT